MEIDNRQSEIDKYFELRGLDIDNYSNFFVPKWLENEISRDKSSKILDFGCGFGQLIGALSKQGFTNLKGVDISSDAVNEAQKRGLPVFLITSIQDFAKGDEKFDVIFMSHVLEHFPKEEVIPTLKLIKENLLLPNGRLFIQVPNAQSPTGLYWMYEDFTHHLLFTAGSLIYVLKASGFTDITFVDPRSEADLNFVQKIKQRLLFYFFVKKTNLWNMATRSQFHKSSPRIYTWELKVKAS